VIPLIIRYERRSWYGKKREPFFSKKLISSKKELIHIKIEREISG